MKSPTDKEWAEGMQPKELKKKYPEYWKAMQKDTGMKPMPVSPEEEKIAQNEKEKKEKLELETPGTYPEETEAEKNRVRPTDAISRTSTPKPQSTETKSTGDISQQTVVWTLGLGSLVTLFMLL